MSKPNNQSENVKVVVRCRPLNSTEKTNNEALAVQVDEKQGVIAVALSNPPTDYKRFTFDYTYPSGTQQELIFNQTAKAIIDSSIAGYNGTIFAYGQTGTGQYALTE